MLPLGPHRLASVLCVGAHSDDIEIGCGGTLLQLQASHPGVRIAWVVFSAEPPRDAEARRSAAAFLRSPGPHVVEVHGFRTSFLPYAGGELKERFELLRARLSPDLVFTHYRHDRHQDHRTLSDLTWNTFRHHLVLEYEVPKYDGDLAAPNVFMPLAEETAEWKVDQLLRHFSTQANKHWFTPDLFRGLMRLRGMECGARYAEAFYGHKLALTHAAPAGPTPAGPLPVRASVPEKSP